MILEWTRYLCLLMLVGRRTVRVQRRATGEGRGAGGGGAVPSAGARAGRGGGAEGSRAAWELVQQALLLATGDWLIT